MVGPQISCSSYAHRGSPHPCCLPPSKDRVCCKNAGAYRAHQGCVLWGHYGMGRIPSAFCQTCPIPLGGSRVTLFCYGDKIRGEGLALALLHLLLLTLPGVALGGRLGGILLSLPVALVLMEDGLDSLLTPKRTWWQCPSVHLLWWGSCDLFC